MRRNGPQREEDPTRRRSSSVLAAVAAMLVVITATACSGKDAASPATTTGTPVVETTTTTEAPLSAGKELFVYSPSVGDCFDKRQLDTKPSTGSGQTDITLKLDCALPHQSEVFDIAQYPSTPDYPGETVLRDFGRKNCVKNFEAFVGKSYELSGLEVGFVVPTAANWGPGREKVGCTLYLTSGTRLVGSMRRSGR